MLSDQKILEMLVQAICGGVGGGFATACSYPFTNLRLRRIAEDLNPIKENEDLEKAPENISNERNRVLFWLKERIEIFNFAFELIKENGFLSLYNGITSSIIGSILQNGIYFCTSKFWGYVLDYLNINLGKLSRTMLVNLIAAFFTAILTNPIWVINARMAKNRDPDIGNIKMIKLIYSEEGLSGFFKGITPSIILIFVPVMQFTSYEALKRSFSNDEGHISNKHLVMISFISKLLTTIVSYPLMTLKALCQSNSHLSHNEVYYRMLKIIKQEGLLGFYKGFGSKIIGSVINNTILMFLYERLQNIVRILLAQLIFGKNNPIISI